MVVGSKFGFLISFNYFILLIMFKINKSDKDIYNYGFDKIVSFTLFNYNILIFSNEGFFTFDSNFNSLYNYTFSTELTIDFNNKMHYPSFTQFSEEEGGYVMCYLLKNIYIFNNKGEFIYLNDANETSNVEDNVNNYIITAYKMENSEYYYTIITFDLSPYLSYCGVLHMFYYKINLSNNKKELIYYNNFYNNSETVVNINSICCEKIVTYDNNNYIICLYKYKKYINYSDIFVIGEIAFEPDKNFSYIEPRQYTNPIFETYYHYSSSVTNDDKSKIYVCYSNDFTNASCFIMILI